MYSEFLGFLFNVISRWVDFISLLKERENADPCTFYFFLFFQLHSTPFYADGSFNPLNNYSEKFSNYFLHKSIICRFTKGRGVDCS